jgi:hypothetical protein
VGLGQLPRLLDYDPGGWLTLAFGIATVVLAVLFVRSQMRDPTWRASWRK